MDIQYLMRQAKKVEKAMEEAKAKLGEISVDADSGGGLVKVRMNGRFEVQRLEIDPKAMEGGDRAMLEDLLAAAVNAAVEKARAAADAQMSAAAGGLKIPGLGF
jgi:DNA-binding YbaB/EbfC family protein